jgi:hypothetical protein
MLALRPPLLKPDRAHSFLCAAGLGQRDKIVSVSICATRWLSQRSTSFASRVRSKVSTAASSGVKLCRLLRKASPANKRHERTSASWEHWFGPSVADSETDLGHSLATDTGLRRISASSFVSQKLDVAIAAEGCSCDSLLPTLCCQYSADPILVSGNCACAGGKCLRRSRRSLRKPHGQWRATKLLSNDSGSSPIALRHSGSCLSQWMRDSSHQRSRSLGSR